MFLMKRNTEKNGQMLVVQTAETLHGCTGDFYTTSNQLDEIVKWGRQHGANEVWMAQSCDLYTLSVRMPNNADGSDLNTAMRYEAASLSHSDQDNILISTFPEHTLPEVKHGTIAAIFEKNTVHYLESELKRLKGMLIGCVSIQQLLLFYHFSEPSLQNKAFILFLEESAFLVTLNNKALSFRNIPFGIHELESNAEQWETRIRRRFVTLEGAQIVLYTEKSNLLLMQKLKEILNPSDLIMQSFDQILPVIFRNISPKLSPACIPVKHSPLQNITLQIIICIILGFSSFTAYETYNSMQRQSELQKQLKFVTDGSNALKEARSYVEKISKERAGEEQRLNVLKGSERINLSLVKVVNLLSRFSPVETRITHLKSEGVNAILLEGESKNQQDMVKFLAYFENVLKDYQLKLKSKVIERQKEKLFTFKYIIEEEK